MTRVDGPAPGDDSARRWPIGSGLADDEREIAYSPSHRLPDRNLKPFLDHYASASAEARSARPPHTLRYGPDTSNTIDLFLPEPTTQLVPLHVFIHGGYWQQLSKLDSAFLAPACLARGQALAALDYTLAPTASLDRIVAECRNALHHLRSEANGLGLDADEIVVSGSSAGAHLAAMATLGLDTASRPAGLILVSGVYLLDPLIGTTINEAVGLDADTAERNSPLRLPLDGLPPTIVAYGDDESDEFKAQSRALVDGLSAAGTDVYEVEVAGRHHFDVVFDIVPSLDERLAEVRRRRPSS